MNLLFQKIETILPEEGIQFYSCVSPQKYKEIKDYVQESGIDYFESHRIHFVWSQKKEWFLSRAVKSAELYAKILAQTLASLLYVKNRRVPKKSYKYAFNAVGMRIFQTNLRGIDFLIDESKIYAQESVIINDQRISPAQAKLLESHNIDVVFVPRYIFSDAKIWLRFSKIALLLLLGGKLEEGRETTSAMLAYVRWKSILQTISVKHFVTYSDFGSTHITRNIVLAQSDIQTWYYNDSGNSGNVLQTPEFLCRHPFWTYLNYDHLITWSSSIKNYFESHPDSFKNSHVVGCLWSSHIPQKTNALSLFPNVLRNRLEGYYIIGVFDTTYSNEGITTYQEGIQFAKDILRLVQSNDRIRVLFKEKKDRMWHDVLDRKKGF